MSAFPEQQQPADQQQRSAAIDPARSFCVTAPAGSGKTELLSQRVLRLLAIVDKPEHILAITFTRKSAAEMHHRIMAALRTAESSSEPEQAHKKLSWQLARAALARNAELGWELLDNSSRLKVQTIDGLCASLTRHMPLLSNFGAQPAIANQPARHYSEAVREFLQLMESEHPLAQDLALLSGHVDNNLSRLEKLLIQLLQTREQWLLHIGIGADVEAARDTLETTLQAVIEDLLKKLQAALQPHAAQLLPLMDYAGCNMQWQDSTSVIATLAGAIELPAADTTQLPAWQALAELLLTKTKPQNWRRKVDKRQGFPTETRDGDKTLAKQLKDDFQLLLQQLNEVNGLETLLAEVAYLPEPHYRTDQWQLLAAITRLLPSLVAELMLVFQRHGEVDYSQISMAALQALGGVLEPSELALKLDYQLQHILIDEFQDTSSSQYRLLERLLEGWQEHNQRNPQAPHTLFIVGDGMQSIYGFRQANVSLFLRARSQGVNGVSLTPLSLTVNFRSDPAVVEWVNQTFSEAFPSLTNLSRGAVPYERAAAFKQPGPEGRVAVYGFSGDKARTEEADKVVALVQQAQQLNPAGSIAILVRSRSHLLDIIPALARQGIRWNAEEIDPLASCSPIVDLLSLTRLLFNQADLLSWAALLRSAWVGLNNSDLLRFFNGGEHHSVLARLADPELLNTLGPGAKQRLQKLAAVLIPAYNQRARYSSRSWVEAVWLALGGAAALQQAEELTLVEDYFDLLESYQFGDSLVSLAEFETAVQSLYATSNTVAEAGHSLLQIMTIHKAKGLEFDTVILPAVARQSRTEDKALFMTREYSSASGSGMIIGPLGDDQLDSIYQYLDHEKTESQLIENTRLFYVAATRAVKQLYILCSATINENSGEPVAPTRNSLVASSWKVLEECVEWQLPEASSAALESGAEFVQIDLLAEDAAIDLQPLDRLPQTWQLPDWSFKNPLQDYYLKSDFDNDTALPVAPQTDALLAASVGTAVHAIFEYLHRAGVKPWQDKNSQQQQQWAMGLLRYQSLPETLLAEAVQLVLEAVDNTVGDQRGQWLLSNRHPHSLAEQAYLVSTSGTAKKLVVDRSFVDQQGALQRGTLWIVDYKTSRPLERESQAAFLAREQEHYRQQLLDYKNILSSCYPQDYRIRTALYFTFYPYFQEVVL